MDGMSLAKIERIIDALRHERYRWPRSGGSTSRRRTGRSARWGCRPGRTSCCEVVRLLLEAYYEPQFSDRSHGFRPGRGCHTALREVADTWTGTTWFIEGDIADCFDSLDHQVLLDDPGGEDPRQPLPAADAQHAQGRIPGGLALARHAQRRAAGRGRQPDPREHLPGQVGRIRGIGGREADEKPEGSAMAEQLRKQMRTMPRSDPNDAGYRRLRYIRYADDHLLGFTGPRAEAEQIKQKLAALVTL